MTKGIFKKSILFSAALSVTILGSTQKSILNFDNNKTLSAVHAKKAAAGSEVLYSAYLTNIYKTANLYASGLDESVFAKAVTGFYNLKKSANLDNDKSIITIVDFNKPSHTKRMWIIDLQSGALLLNTWVAHGQGSGDDMANQFSNIDSSHQSSLGFYLTGEIYTGKHGRSLRLDGMDANFNSNARQRSIVVHAADYVSQQAINSLGRIGRSFGCPAVAPDLAPTIINTIKNKTVLFINGSDSKYHSKYLNENLAANYLFPEGKEHGPLQAML
jgi:hypothetical protein